MKKIIALNIILSSICASSLFAEIVLKGDYPHPPSEVDSFDDVIFSKPNDIATDSTADLYIKDHIVAKKLDLQEKDALEKEKEAKAMSDARNAKLLEGFIDVNDGFVDRSSTIVNLK